MGIFSRIKNGISSKANAAIDKAVSPEKELEIAIAELEDGRKKAMAELVSYKVTAKQLDADVEKHKAKAVEWERRAMVAIKAGDDEAAKLALREKKAAEAEATRIERDKHEAASYAIQLNKSRKEFETKLAMLKMRKGTLATQLAVARSPGGDAFGNDTSVWDRFKEAEDRIDSEAIATEVDAAMRGEDAAADHELDAKLAKVAGTAGLLGVPDGPDDALAKLKDKMAEQKAAKQKQLEAGAASAANAAGAASAPSAPGAANAPSAARTPSAPSTPSAKDPKGDK
jgi:phage shock protein A